MTERSRMFCISRMLPGHGYLSHSSNVRLSIRWILLAIFSANRLTTYATRIGISSRRVRRGGHLNREDDPFSLLKRSDQQVPLAIVSDRSRLVAAITRTSTGDVRDFGRTRIERGQR